MIFVNVLKVCCEWIACLVVKKKELDIKSQTVINSTFIHSLVLWQRAINCEKNDLNQDKEILSCPKRKKKPHAFCSSVFLSLCHISSSSSEIKANEIKA